MGAQPAESPEGHDAVLPGPGVAGKRLHVLTEYDQQGSHCSSPGSDHALATHRRRWGFEQLRDVRAGGRQGKIPRRASQAKRDFFAHLPTLFLLVSGEFWSGQRAALQQRASTGSHTDCGARAALALPAPALSTNFTNSSTLGPRGKAKGPLFCLNQQSA